MIAAVLVFLSLSLCLDLRFCLSLYFSLSLPLFLSISTSLCVCLYLFIHLSVCLSASVFISHSHPPLCVYFSLSYTSFCPLFLSVLYFYLSYISLYTVLLSVLYFSLYCTSLCPIFLSILYFSLSSAHTPAIIFSANLAAIHSASSDLSSSAGIDLPAIISWNRSGRSVKRMMSSRSVQKLSTNCDLSYFDLILIVSFFCASAASAAFKVPFSPLPPLPFSASGSIHHQDFILVD